jgi:hypothetical protein
LSSRPLPDQAQPLIVLVPSPLLGPFSWSLVAGELESRGRHTVISADPDDSPLSEPAWRQTTDGVVATLQAVPSDRPVALIGHSNAGPLLPAIGSSVAQPVVAYVFVDARLPHGGVSRLDAVAAVDPAVAAERRAALEAGRPYPAWSDMDLSELLPDPEVRQSLLAELRPRGLAYWIEPLPEVPGWPDAPCAYLLFSSPYRSEADRARRDGWRTRELPAGHFHQLVDPPAVADALVELLASSSA